jgi:hypothetical protein
MQFGNGYRHKGKHYNGVGTGMGSGETDVQHSYNDYDTSGRPAKPVREYNAPVIANYPAQLENLANQLTESLRANKTVVLRGGGMGAGAEPLMPNAQEYGPHALVICLVEGNVGDPAKTLDRLQAGHCPGDAAAAGGYSHYQKLLLDAAPPRPTGVQGHAASVIHQGQHPGQPAELNRPPGAVERTDRATSSSARRRASC